MALDYQAAVQELLDACRILLSMNGEHLVRSATTAAPPASPVLNDAWLLPANPTGAWAGRAGNIAQWNGSSWQFTAPTPGKTAFALDTGNKWQRSLTAWGIVPGVVSNVGVSGQIGDLLGNTYPRTLVVPQLELRIEGNAHIWLRNFDGTDTRALLYSDAASKSFIMRTYPEPGSTAVWYDVSVRADGQVWGNNVQTDARALTSKQYVDAAITASGAVAHNAIGSTMIAGYTGAGTIAIGATCAGADLGFVRVATNGSWAAAGTLGVGTWRNCGNVGQAGYYQIWRRVA